MKVEIVCPYCGHVWMRNTDTKSRACPKCHRIVVPRTPREMLTCNRCGNVWEPRASGKVPGTCPKCKSPYWNKERVRWQPHNLRNHRRTWKLRMCAIHAHTPYSRKNIGGTLRIWWRVREGKPQRSFRRKRNVRCMRWRYDVGENERTKSRMV